MTSGVVLLLLAAAIVAQERYDLGGPCIDDPRSPAVGQLLRAEKAGSWDQAAAFAKQSVRTACGIQYRWHSLVNALVRAHREPEAAMVLAEMDARGFDLSPSAFGPEHDAVRKFMEKPEF